MKVQTLYVRSRIQTKSPLFLDLFSKLTDDIACRTVFAHIVRRRPRAKYACAGLLGTPDLCSCLPDHLSEMRRRRVIWIVIRNFNHPVVDHLLDSVDTTASSQVFAYAAKLATRVLKDTTIRPLLSKIFEIEGIGQRHRPVLSTCIIVELEIIRSIA